MDAADAAENGRGMGAPAGAQQHLGSGKAPVLGPAKSFNTGRSRGARRAQELEAQVAVLGEDAAEKMVRMGNEEAGYNQVEIERKFLLPRGLIHPKSRSYRLWWWITIVAACITGWLEPYQIGFLPPTQRDDPPLAIVQYILLAIFLVDIFMSFTVSKYKRGVLMTDRKKIALNYVKFRLWWDLLTTLPWDDIVLAGLNLTGDSRLARYVGLLGLLKLGRMYRLGRLFRHLVYNLAVGLLVTTTIRNLLLMFYLVHWFGCIFFFIARQETFFSGHTWVAEAGEIYKNKTPFEWYLVSMYWALSTFYTIGDGDLSPVTTAEVVWVLFYIVVNVFAWAYIMGSITLLVFKADEKVCHYRHTMRGLDAYFKAHGLPRDLKSLVQSHLRLQLTSGEVTDDAMLAQLPGTIRHKVLQAMYNQQLHSCWLLAGVKPKFLDGLLGVSKVQTLMPRVEVLGQGDQVHDLFIVVDGYVELFVNKNSAEDRDKKNIIAHYSKTPAEIRKEMAEAKTAAGSGYQVLGPGDVFGEMAFFTEVPQLELVRCLTVCRLMTISRPAYQSITNDLPQSARKVLANLQGRAEAVLQQEFRGGAASRLLRGSIATTLPGLTYTWASAETVADQRADETSRETSGSMGGTGGLTARQEQVVANLQRVKALVKQAVASALEARTGEFLSAAARGEQDRVKLMLQQGFQPDTADYDNRTALMLAAANGRKLVVEMLLAAGASPSLKDNLGSCALSEAVKAGQDDILSLLLAKGARLNQPPALHMQQLSAAVTAGDVPRIERLLEAGANVNAEDFDRNTALHIAAADGNLAAVKVLLERGRGVRLDLRNRHGNTPLDEARAAQAQGTVEYLEQHVSPEAREAARERFEENRADAALRAAAAGDVARMRLLLERGCPADVADYDMRTALMLGTAKGHKPVVDLLLSAGAHPNVKDNLGACALMEAVKGGHQEIAEALMAAGASLCLGPGELAGRLCSMVYEGQELMLRRYIGAGADVDVGDYDKRTALHIAAAEGKMDMVKLLVEEGGADTSLTDRWGATAWAEADRVGAKAVADYLKGAAAARVKSREAKGAADGSSSSAGGSSLGYLWRRGSS